MQNLTIEERESVEVQLLDGRQWRRSERIPHAKRNLKLAYRTKDASLIAIAKTILRRLDYDYYDIATSKERV